MPGFFSSDELIPTSRSYVPRCGACGLRRGCLNPVMPVHGKGKRGILVVAEAPGRQEDEEGIPLVGKSGQLLRKTLKRLGVDLDRDCWKTNACICRPSDNKTPTNNQIDSCRPNLLKVIEDLQPQTIILLGGSAVESLVGHLWREKPGAIGRWVGWLIPSQAINAWVCPTYHPAYLVRSEDPVLDSCFEAHLESAVEKTDRPYPEGVSDYLDQIQLILEPERAARMIRGLMEREGPIAFDYETNMLKPDHPDAEIVSCAICWRGKKTMAFPWHGAAVIAMGELLSSSVRKIGANIKFEERWTQMVFGHGVRNWVHDTMLMSHVLSHRPGITSVKFQAFVLLGHPDYAAAVSPYLRSDGSNSLNRIRELDLTTLLKYNALDAILEYKIAEAQCQKGD